MIGRLLCRLGFHQMGYDLFPNVTYHRCLRCKVSS